MKLPKPSSMHLADRGPRLDDAGGRSGFISQIEKLSWQVNSNAVDLNSGPSVALVSHYVRFDFPCKLAWTDLVNSAAWRNVSSVSFIASRSTFVRRLTVPNRRTRSAT